MEKKDRLKIIAQGAVQGVGFRPFVHRLATELEIHGFILNSPAGVFIEAEGQRERLDDFRTRLQSEKPARAILQSVESTFLDPVGYEAFEIRESDLAGAKTTLILPDINVCADCLREMFDPTDRRFLYPFTNCTNCGPRFSIVESLPYDRSNTSMKQFAMCGECEREYNNPADRRFHAQPNACPQCGPQLALWDATGKPLALTDRALRRASECLRSGLILALKGIGGFQLLVDARVETAVRRLRDRKHREEKPFAVMFPALPAVQEFCESSDLEQRLLLSPESPIVLLRRKLELSAAVAPRNPNLGAMLPYTPLHHLLMRQLGFPVVATSGNLSDEPICTDEHEALQRLAGIADVFLVHNRPIVRPIDDSVVRVMCGRELILRRARGYAPLPVTLTAPVPTLLALGAHLKNTIALSVDANVFISQHIGDLATSQAYTAFTAAAADLPRLYDASPRRLACDLHPDYLSTKYAQEQPTSTVKVQHHFAHIVSCMAENEIECPLLGVAFDGTGLGTDRTIWGGEFLVVENGRFKRVAHLRTFGLPGGEAAVREPRRAALGILHQILGEDVWNHPILDGMFSQPELSALRTMLENNLNTPRTSSAGRLFDAVAALLLRRERASFEGQAAMELEFAARFGVSDGYKFHLLNDSPAIIDWEPVILAIIEDMRRNEPVDLMAAKFHNGLADAVVAVAEQSGQKQVVLSGGCFQNCYLTEELVRRLEAADFCPYWHRRVPPNDGGIPLGQVIAASWQLPEID